jgi:hypothetical protein
MTRTRRLPRATSCAGVCRLLLSCRRLLLFGIAFFPLFMSSGENLYGALGIGSQETIGVAPGQMPPPPVDFGEKEVPPIGPMMT